MKVYRHFLLIPFLIAFIAMSFVQASPGLNVTVTTDKLYYIPEETVNVNGTLTRNNSPVEDGLVAIQIEDPNNYSVVVRTQQTDTNSTAGLIEIIEAVPSDPNTGEPKSSFNIGELFGLKVTVNNTDSNPHFVRVIINAYDASGVTLGTSAGIGTVNQGSERFFIIPIPIPITAYTGNAIAYASVYTDWPRNGGVPYCPEVSASFEIVGSGVQGSTDSETQSSTPGTYGITFKLSTNAKAGTYTAYATSSYAGENANASTTFNFEVAIPIVVPEGTFYIVLETNSTLYNLSTFKFDKATRDGRTGELSFPFTGLTDYTSFFRLTIPKGLWTGNPWLILIDNDQILIPHVSDIGDFTVLDFNYPHPDTSTHTLQIYGSWVVPEFPTSMLLPLLIIATLAVAILAQKTRLTKRRKTATVR